MRISDWSSDVCSSDLDRLRGCAHRAAADVGDGFHCGRQAFLGRPEAQGKARLLAGVLGVDLGIVGLDPLRATDAAVEALAVTLFQPQPDGQIGPARSAEPTSELQSLMRISYYVFCLKKKKKHTQN